MSERSRLCIPILQSTAFCCSSTTLSSSGIHIWNLRLVLERRNKILSLKRLARTRKVDRYSLIYASFWRKIQLIIGTMSAGWRIKYQVMRLMRWKTRRLRGKKKRIGSRLKKPRRWKKDRRKSRQCESKRKTKTRDTHLSEMLGLKKARPHKEVLVVNHQRELVVRRR